MNLTHSGLDEELLLLREAVMKRLERVPGPKLTPQIVHGGPTSAREANQSASSTHQMDSKENSASESWFRRLLQRVKLNSN